MAGYVGRDAVIVGAVRTPIGKGKAGGALHDVLPNTQGVEEVCRAIDNLPG